MIEMSAELQVVGREFYSDAQHAVDAPQAVIFPRAFRSCALPVTPVSERIGTIVSIMVAAVAVWFLAGQEARINSLNYNIDRLQAQVNTTELSNSWMAAQVDKLKEPSRILGIAEGQLHMEFAPAVPLNTDETTAHR